jgi:glutathione S-transferase
MLRALFASQGIPMKLYFSPGACSLSPHIVAHELGLPLEIERVDLGKKITASGVDFRTINPKGYVPTLVLDDGTVMCEAAALSQYLGDRKPEAGLIPAHGTIERYRVIERLTFISSEVHKGMGMLFGQWSDETRAALEAKLATRLDWLNADLSAADYLEGNRFGVADAYLFTVLGWARLVKVDLTRWPALIAYQQRIAARPAVHSAMVAEGLIKA